MSGQRWNNFCSSYRDISFVVAENSRVVKPKCRQFTSLNKMFNNFSKVLIVDISYTALINNEGISGIREAPKRIKFTFSNLLRDVRDEKRSLMISGCQKCQSNLANLVFALYFAYSGRFCHEWRPKANKRFREIRDLEIDFLKEQLNGFSVEGDYCFFFFNIFINNLPRVIDFTILSTYADDTQIFYAEDKVTDVE